MVSMPLVITYDWMSESLLYQLARMNAGDMRIGLYKSLIAPTEDTDFAEIEPADFSGYSGPKPLTAWTANPGGRDTPRWRITHPAVIWTPTGITPGTVWGYYVFQDVTNKLWWAQERDSSITVGDGNTIPYVVIPTYTRRSEYPGDV